MAEITLTMPDGSKRAFKAGGTGRELAESIAKSLAKKAVAMVVDGRLADLADPIDKDAAVKIVTRTDPEALELIRHDAAHVMAEAVQDLWPGTQVTIGPVIENGFFYDFAKEEPFHPDDLARIEARMHEIIARNAPFTKEFWSREQAKDFFKKKGELFKIELVDAIPGGRGPQNLQAGRLARPLPRPAHDLHRPDRQGLQAHPLCRLLLARQFRRPQAAAHLRHRLGERARACHLSQAARGGREARPQEARARDGPVPLPGGGAGRRVLAPQGLGAVPGPHQLHPAAAERGRLSRGERSADPRQVHVGDLRAIGRPSASTCSPPSPRTSASSSSSR